MVLETEFMEVLEMIVTNLGIAAERIFGIFVSAQMVIGIIDVLSIILAFVAAIMVGKGTWKVVSEWCKDDDGDWMNDDSKISVLIASVIAAFAALMIAGVVMSLIGGAVLKIACPEYTAMKEIIRLVR